MPQESETGDYLPRGQIFFLCVNIIFAMAGMGIVAPILPDLQAWSGGSYAQMGVIVSSFALARVVADLPAGVLIDRFGGGILTALAMSVIMLGSLLSALAPSFNFLLVGRVVAGMGSAVAVTGIETELLILAGISNRSRVMSYFMISRRIGSSAFPFIGGVLTTLFNWRAVFYATVLLNLVGVVLALLFSRLRQRGRKAEKIAGKSHDDQKIDINRGTGGSSRVSYFSFVVLYFLAFSFFVNRNGLEKTTIPLFGSSIGLDSMQIGLMLSISSLFSVISILAGGRIADRFGRKPVLQLGIVAMVVTNGVFLLVDDYSSFLLAGLLFAMASFALGLPQVMATDLVAVDKAGRTLGGIRLFNDAGTVIGPTLLGWTMDTYGFSSSVLLAALSLVIAFVLVTFFLPESGFVIRKGTAELSTKNNSH